MNFKRKILSLLILIISTFYTLQSNANYLDIGYREGLEIKALIRVTSPLYIKASKYNSGESIGLGAGYNANNFSAILTLNQISEVEKIFNTELELLYYDTSFNYSASLRYDENKDLGFNFGVGYALTEKTSFNIEYINKAVFVGIRTFIF